MYIAFNVKIITSGENFTPSSIAFLNGSIMQIPIKER